MYLHLPGVNEGGVGGCGAASVSNSKSLASLPVSRESRIIQSVLSSDDCLSIVVVVVISKYVECTYTVSVL